MSETRYFTAIGGLEVHTRIGEAWGTWEQDPLPPAIADAIIPAVPIRFEDINLKPILPTSCFNGRTAKGRARRS